MNFRFKSNSEAQEAASPIKDLARCLHGGAVTLGVVRVRRQGHDATTLTGEAAGPNFQVDPLDLDTQSVETICLEQHVVIRRGSTSGLRLTFASTTPAPTAVLEVTLCVAHFDNLFDEVKRWESKDGAPPRASDLPDLAMTGHLSVMSQLVGDRGVATALAEDVFIFGWREEFGYDTDGIWAKPEKVEPARPEEAEPPEIIRQTNLAEILRKNLEESQAPCKDPVCPHCAAPMVRRRAHNGPNAGRDFWGCSRYPNCRGTRSIEVA